MFPKMADKWKQFAKLLFQKGNNKGIKISPKIGTTFCTLRFPLTATEVASLDRKICHIKV